jgi:hypothetical protein
MPLEKFGFRIRAQNGAVVERLVIQASCEEEARVKLTRMYPQCEVLGFWIETSGTTSATKSFEDIADLLNH